MIFENLNLSTLLKYTRPLDEATMIYSKYYQEPFSSKGLTTKKQKKRRAASKRAKSARKK